jgi:hypothetical protein
MSLCWRREIPPLQKRQKDGTHGMVSPRRRRQSWAIRPLTLVFFFNSWILRRAVLTGLVIGVCVPFWETILGQRSTFFKRLSRSSSILR